MLYLGRRAGQGRCAEGLLLNLPYGRGVHEARTLSKRYLDTARIPNESFHTFGSRSLGSKSEAVTLTILASRAQYASRDAQAPG
jgi:hypothetical protein